MTLPNRNSKANIRRTSDWDLVEWTLGSPPSRDPGRALRLRARRAVRAERLRRRKIDQKTAEWAEIDLEIDLLAGEFRSGKG